MMSVWPSALCRLFRSAFARDRQQHLALTSSTTFSDLAAVRNIRVLGYTTDAIGPPSIGSAWYAHRDWISANGDVARKCVQALTAAGRWANAHQDASGEVLTRY